MDQPGDETVHLETPVGTDARDLPRADRPYTPTRDEILAVCRDNNLLSHVAQPIIDLGRGTIVGFEVLARFLQGSPDTWFAAATSHGLAAQLDAIALRKALHWLPDLPRNTFLTVNIEPHSLLDEAVQAVFREHGNLDRLVVELTEHSKIGSFASLRKPIEQLRAAGAMIAADDVGSGYAGMQMLLEMRPQIVKIDGSLVSGIDRDPAKRAVVRMLGELAGRIDAWVLAEGIEREEELTEIMRLGVPLAQGFYLRRPQTPFDTAMSLQTTALIRGQAAQLSAREQVSSIMDVVPLVPSSTEPPDQVTAVEVNAYSRPYALLHRGERVISPLVVQSTEYISDVAKRVVGRAGELTPVIVVDVNGRAQGIVRPRQLLSALADRITTEQ
ncbi:EAL domain-containing protein [Euzebya tangerina]|uniref:EAL domain-containing protein n=1 Tax=Euzebya tangerina TaxID=591198 RepID=UPI0013C310B6|nr:EAL domain-containing protein [Euzebya tangerina]